MKKIQIARAAGEVPDYTLDNRRLVAFQKAGLGRSILYRMATRKEVRSEGWKFSTKNDGVGVNVRDGDGYHWNERLGGSNGPR